MGPAMPGRCTSAYTIFLNSYFFIGILLNQHVLRVSLTKPKCRLINPSNQHTHKWQYSAMG